MTTKVTKKNVKLLRVINRDDARHFLRNCDFKSLFIESLGWNKANDSRNLVADEQTYTFEAFAQISGVTAYRCRVADVFALTYQTRAAVERAAGALFPSHLFVFHDDDCNCVWQWSRRELGQPRQLRSAGPFTKTSSFELLFQKLDLLQFDIDDGNVQATDVDARLKNAFNVEPVTKSFYRQFETEYKEFLAAIQGVAKPYEAEFASLMLNRLMFLYFMQSKGFLLDDEHYLKNKFDDKSARIAGHDDYLSGFLAPLFFEVLSVKEPERTDANIKIFGKMLYLNGGLFSRREWEKGGKIQIDDAAFDKIFAFFSKWQWQLDERPTRKGDEINPDVLGYVFEKFINQKQMGAYYTKEDITGYISRNTILPLLWEKAGLDSQRPLDLLRANLARYLYPAVKHGCDLDLPADIEAGIGDVSKRDGWNATATPDLGLPTEIWREVVARRARYHALASGEIAFNGVSDLITHNLDIEQWFADVVADIIEPKQLEGLWTALEEITILDPTVGSGAFLFAAMGVLGPVYGACLERMDGFVAEAKARAQKQEFVAPPAFELFAATLREIEGHPNRAYAIYKKLTVGNLFGVDIMPEATEICKLRLFLKLAAQVSPDKSAKNWGIEPLPDIDFNIRAGNTLVGFARASEVEASSKTQMNFGATWGEIEVQMREYGEKLENFRYIQLGGDGVAAKVKDELNAKHDKLVEKLNLFNAGQYAQAPISEPERYAAWKASHQPFHWCAEFYNVMQNGGFDVIIGNPPYVETKDVKTYTFRGFKTLECRDLYALVMERVISVSSVGARLGVIVPLSCFAVDRFSSLQTLYFKNTNNIFISSWSGDAHPSKLFEGVNKRLQIILSRRCKETKMADRSCFVSSYLKWYSDERPTLFNTRLNYVHLPQVDEASFFPTSIGKLSNPLEESIIRKLKSFPTRVGLLTSDYGKFPLYYTRKVSFFLQFLDFIPEIANEEGEIREPSELKQLLFDSEATRNVSLAGLSTSLFYWFNILNSDCRNLNKREVVRFPLPDIKDEESLEKIKKLLTSLMKSYKANAKPRTITYAGMGKVTVPYFNFRPSKPIIDEIDRVLAGHYGFTDEELDFIINYDIKYRMGREASDD